jgi:hypothetical protein
MSPTGTLRGDLVSRRRFRLQTQDAEDASKSASTPRHSPGNATTPRERVRLPHPHTRHPEQTKEKREGEGAEGGNDLELTIAALFVAQHREWREHRGEGLRASKNGRVKYVRNRGGGREAPPKPPIERLLPHPLHGVVRRAALGGVGTAGAAVGRLGGIPRGIRRRGGVGLDIGGSGRRGPVQGSQASGGSGWG